jgi:hypothetical protein
MIILTPEALLAVAGFLTAISALIWSIRRKP